ncbi:hypothetical protein AVP42_01918 [Agromyces sp. NDB4Y10]|uniref:hypothetical protein n=1 Tax=Agromyces sp. NDB4Y10 TaxID=1775951 RepID=UPI0007B27716|nr:hypothetical protein [Agromyces sp. NDB4Y10]KZE93303.1 hypothetical protein AVP42_01918 [Agromyces sp. NDB4Y10]
MSGLSDNRRVLVESVAEEFLHNSRRGRRLVAVEGASDAPAARFADDLATILGERGQHAVRVSLGDVDEATLRRDTIEPFRAGTLPGADEDAVLVVDGRRLLNDAVRGVWHFTVWTLAGDDLPHSGVNVDVDVTDEDSPKRYFYDLCKLPPSFGERRPAAS